LFISEKVVFYDIHPHLGEAFLCISDVRTHTQKHTWAEG